MAEMNIKQILDRLNAEFTGDTRKLVFWYDDNSPVNSSFGTMITASLWRICRM